MFVKLENKTSDDGYVYFIMENESSEPISVLSWYPPAVDLFTAGSTQESTPLKLKVLIGLRNGQWRVYSGLLNPTTDTVTEIKDLEAHIYGQAQIISNPENT